MRNFLSYLILPLVIFIWSASPAEAVIWGVKTHDPASSAPSTLFKFQADGSSFEAVGVITLAGLQVDVDGLALDSAGTLYAFVPGDASGLLITIDPFSAQATEIGYVSGREIRGAAFTANDELIGVDIFEGALVQVNPLTGQQVGSAVNLNFEGEPFLPYAMGTDLAIRANGQAFICNGTMEIYQVDLASGELTLFFPDEAPGIDGAILFGAGLAFPQDAIDDRLVLYDVNSEDDIFGYELSHPFTRTIIFSNIIMEYNAGRGDLASFPYQEISSSDEPGNIPVMGRLGQNVPNPFNPQTTISFDLVQPAQVFLRVFDSSGRLVKTLINGELQAEGRREINWNGRDTNGRMVSAGVYFYRLDTPQFKQTKRMTLVK
ncbi:MAG: T9SS type A sorting domain-containing protein [bacterium]|nr:T9SS type A sorting domain-containing protein [bacterium]